MAFTTRYSTEPDSFWAEGLNYEIGEEMLTGWGSIENGHDLLRDSEEDRNKFKAWAFHYTSAEYDHFHLIRFVNSEVAERIATGRNTEAAKKEAFKLFEEPGESLPDYENYFEISEVDVLQWGDLHLVLIGRSI